MVDEINKRRKISKEEIVAIRNKVFHPQDALKLKLIDEVSTFENFKETNYPNHSVDDYVYRIDGTRLKNILTAR